MNNPPDRRYHSHAFENMAEHLLLADVLRHMWFVRGEVVEVAQAQVDAWGYDLVLALGRTTRYVQLKTSVPADVNERLGEREGGCVVATLLENQGRTLTYRYWNADPSELANLPPAERSVYKRGQDTRSKRRGHRRVNAGRFTKKMDVAELCDALFGR